ncbi:MAG: adenylate/guanylate cyclase domain-containing protein [Treponemataceae bacterium]
MKQRKRAPGIGTKVNAAILATLVLGFGAVTGYFGWSLVTTRQSLTSVSLQREADLLATSVVNFMMPGEAPIAVAFFNDVSLRNPEFEIALYRRDGSGAFSDSTTAAGVNKRIRKDRFPLEMIRPVFPPADREALAPTISLPPSNTIKEAVVRKNSGEEARIVSVYRPLINLPKCVGCHGGDHTIRGVVRVSTDISAAVSAQRSSVAISGGIFFVMVALVGAGLSRFMKRAVVAPVTEIGALCRRVASGDFEGAVEYRAADEIGELARTVNEMALGLRERSELVKYVSGSTMSALHGDQKGKRERRTLLFSDVRGFTAFSERLPAEIVVEALNRLLDAQARAVAAHGGDVDKFVGDQIVAVFSGANAEKRACLAAAEMHRVAAGKAGDVPGGHFSVGAGIAAGDVIQGMIGSSSRADFTVIGDAVNIAARLCSAAKPGMTLVHSGAAALLVGDTEVLFDGPYRLALKGKKEKQIVYLLKGAADGS